MNEVQMLVDTPCKDDVLKRAFLFSILTGLRHSDIQALRWKQIQQTSKGTWQALVVQQKTKRPDYKPVTAQALQLCGERPDDDERLVFEGLTDVSWISIPLKAWIEASGIKKHVTFHLSRHTFGSIICLSQGIPIETVSKIMGHKHIKTTQRYAKVTQDKIDRDVDRLNEAIGGKFSLYGIDTRPSTIRKDITRRKSNPSWKQAAIIKQMMEG